jgi:hypothetical protein
VRTPSTSKRRSFILRARAWAESFGIGGILAVLTGTQESSSPENNATADGVDVESVGSNRAGNRKWPVDIKIVGFAVRTESTLSKVRF